MPVTTIDGHQINVNEEGFLTDPTEWTDEIAIALSAQIGITLTDKQPPTTWNLQGPSEYGFYSNVNPQVDHPRWSQSSERVLGAGLFDQGQPTLMFNGYEAEVASLYAGMDLKANY